tara:strand:- start:3952 stop:4443 length:492 start_codon:yes stop_codon:yes gene_type:complete
MNKTQKVALAFLAAESASAVGTAEYANKLETIRTILYNNGRDIEDIQSYTPEALCSELIDLVLKLNEKVLEHNSGYLGDSTYLNFDDPDVLAEIDQSIESHQTIKTMSIGKLRVLYTKFYFSTRTQAERFAVASVLLQYCAEKGYAPEPLWSQIKSKGGLMDA